ncbi:MAG: T9SS type A sorting domain-containing protein, partial [Chitinophagales bacterium]
DVVMHEYGHGINSDLYSWLGDPGGMGNGAMNEGYADVWAICVTDNPILGQGFTGGAGTYVRRYDIAPKVYPQDLVGEVHADGEIIAGAWWDVEENMDHTFMVDLYNETQNGTPDASDGNEGELYRDVLLEALLADDDNADLADGTPNDDAITAAFCEHGITLIGNLSIDHTEFSEPVAVLTPIPVETELDVDFPEYIGSVTMNWRTSPGAAYTATAMTLVAGTSYEASIPAQPQGTIIEYYFKIEDTNACSGVVLPSRADLATEPNLPYFIIVGYELQEFEDFDNEFGSWIVDPLGTDDATTGIWDINTPLESIDATGYQVQGDVDHTTGTGNLCAFTGNSGDTFTPGNNDVDGGVTTIRSPFFDVTPYTDPVFAYYRTYSNASPTSANPGNDVWEVFITDDGIDWIRVERTHTEDNTWRRNVVRISDYVSLTEDVALLFIAEDSVRTDDASGFDGGSLVEAKIDDLFLYDWSAIDTTEDTTHQAINEELIIAGVFPNPANETVNVFFGNISGDVDIVISNSIGEIMLTDKITVGANSVYTFNSSGFAQGIYTLSAKNENNVSNKRIIIQH